MPLSLPGGLEDVAAVIEKDVMVAGEINFIVHGTGFFLSDSTTNTVYLVTNRHVFQNQDSVFVRFNTADGQSSRKRARLRDESGNVLWRGHPDSTIDVAVVPLVKGMGVRLLDMPRIKALSDIEPGDEVCFIGFPLLEYTGKDKTYPIFRHGIVSFISKETITSILNPDSVILNKDMILIDATSLAGNSGGPVISTPKPGANRASLIGIIQGYIFYVQTGENLDLGIVVPAERIMETIDTFRAK